MWNVGLANTIFFLGSRGHVYEEAILSGLCFALVTVYFCLAGLKPQHYILPLCAIFLAVCLLIVVQRQNFMHFVLFFVLVLGLKLVTWGTQNPGSKYTRSYRPLLPCALIGVAGFLSIISLIGQSWDKFHCFEIMPYKYYLRALADPDTYHRLGGSMIQVSNVPYQIASYFLWPTFFIKPVFPYLDFSYVNPAWFSGCKLFDTEPILALPYSMMSLTFLTLTSLSFFARRLFSPIIKSILIINLFSFLPSMGLLLCAAGSTHRYTADFIPFLLLSGLPALAYREHSRSNVFNWPYILILILSGFSSLIGLITIWAGGGR